MNWVDIVVISVVALSALLAFTRGLVREVLGIGSWIAAGVIAVYARPYVQTRLEMVVHATDIAELLSLALVFLVALVALSVLANKLAGLLRSTGLGGLDRTLGMLFGLVRGLGFVVVTYIVAGMLVPLDQWPDPLQQARTLPYIYDGAVLAVSLLPEEHRPIVPVPPGAHEIRAADLLRINPLGRSTARP